MRLLPLVPVFYIATGRAWSAASFRYSRLRPSTRPPEESGFSDDRDFPTGSKDQEDWLKSVVQNNPKKNKSLIPGGELRTVNKIKKDQHRPSVNQHRPDINQHRPNNNQHRSDSTEWNPRKHTSEYHAPERNNIHHSNNKKSNAWGTPQHNNGIRYASYTIGDMEHRNLKNKKLESDDFSSSTNERKPNETEEEHKRAVEKMNKQNEAWKKREEERRRREEDDLRKKQDEEMKKADEEKRKREEENRKREEENRKREEENRKREEEKRKREEERKGREEERRKREEENRKQIESDEELKQTAESRREKIKLLDQRLKNVQKQLEIMSTDVNSMISNSG